MPATNYWWKAVNAVHQKILAQSLPGIASENIKLQRVADDKSFTTLPGISVSPYGAESLDPNAGGNVMDDPGYPVLVGILDTKDEQKAAPLETWLQWRETLIAALHHKNGTNFTFDGSAISTQSDTIVLPGSVIVPEAWFSRQVCLGTFVVRVNVRRLHV